MKSKKILKKFMVLLLTITMIIPSNLQMVFAKQQNKNLIKLQTKTITLDKGAKKQVKVIASSKCKIKKIELIKNSNKKVTTAKILKSKIYLIGNKKGKATITIRVKYSYKKKTKIEKLQLQVNIKEKSKVEGMIKLSTGNLTVNEKETKQVKIIIPSKQYKIKSVTVKNNNEKIANIKASKSKLDITGLKEGNTVGNIVVKYEYKKKIKTKEFKLQIKVTKLAQKITIHTASFESNGGSPIAAVKIAEGEILEKPITDPQKEGYTFDGWYSDKDLNTIYDFSQKVYNDMTLYAKWKENKEPKVYTRSEWIKILIDSLGIKEEEISNNENEDTNYECADINEDVNADEIREAYSRGIIPDEREDKEQDVIFFEPTKIVTREYMAYTLSKALGFQDMDEHAKVRDINESPYSEEIYNVVRAKAMTLDNDKFYPNQIVKEEDIELAKEKINYWITPEEIKEHDDSILKEDVKDFRDYNDYEVINKDDNYILKLNKKLSDDQSLKVGDKVILGKNANDDSRAFIVLKINNNGQYECKEATINDVYSKIDFATKEFYVDPNNIKVADGVNMDYKTSNLRRGQFGGETKLLKNGELKFDLGNGIRLTDNLKLAGKVKISIPEIVAKINADIGFTGMKINDFDFKVEEQTDINAGIYLKNNQECELPYENLKEYIKSLKNDAVLDSCKYTLCEIPLKSIKIADVNLKIFLEIGSSGEITVGTTINTTQEIKYKDGVLQATCSKKAKFDPISMSGSGFIDGGIGLDIDTLKETLFGIDLQGGIGAEIGLDTQLTYSPLVCFEAKIYPEIKFKIDKKTIIGGMLSKKKDYEFIYKLYIKKLHMEKFRAVEKCTYGQGNIDGYVLYAKNDSPVEKAQIEVYTKGSQNEEIPIKTVYTDQFGYYNIKELSVGKYDIKIKVSGCNQTLFKDIEIKKGETYTLKTVKVGERVKIIKTNSIALGENNSAAIREDGSLWMWGDNRNNKISDETTEKEILQPKKIMDNVKTVSLGSVNSAAIKNDGTLWLWGTTILDEILNLPKSESFKPYKIMDNVKSVSLGGSTGAAIKNDGSLWMWGSNVYGQLGDGTQLECRTPKKIMENVKSVSVGTNYTAAIKEDGTLWMWGDNSNGKIGDVSVARYLTPKKIMDNVKMVSLNGTNHSAVVKEDGTLWTWGWNGYGQLGDGTTNELHAPKKIMEGVKTVSLGGTNSAAIKEDGSLWMWGSNSYYKQLKTDKQYSCTTPQKIAENVKDVKLSVNHVAYINDKGVLWCMGRNSEGQLGDGTKVDSDSPKEIKLGN